MYKNIQNRQIVLYINKFLIVIDKLLNYNYSILEVYVYAYGCYQKMIHFTREMMYYTLVIVYCEHLYF